MRANYGGVNDNAKGQAGSSINNNFLYNFIWFGTNFFYIFFPLEIIVVTKFRVGPIRMNYEFYCQAS